jgi:aryl-alcohol dehydrogenase-like predicted oxidoreductase
MEYRNLGRTGVRVSSLCLGTMMFGRSANAANKKGSDPFSTFSTQNEQNEGQTHLPEKVNLYPLWE